VVLSWVDLPHFQRITDSGYLSFQLILPGLYIRTLVE
jgi:hypothetical protein